MSAGNTNLFTYYDVSKVRRVWVHDATNNSHNNNRLSSAKQKKKNLMPKQTAMGRFCVSL